MDSDLIRLWGLIAELSDQLNSNRSIAANLQQQADALKGQAIHAGTGFALRRFNTDISKEQFESELERMNAQIMIENQKLQHENKQLSGLLKEYEQTLETVMAKFRTQAYAAQQHELTLTRHYESLLLQRDTSALSTDLVSSTALSSALSRLSHNLRLALRAVNGEDPSSPSSPSESEPQHALEEEGTGGYSGTPNHADWALEREIEIVRLEKENEELRRLLSIGEAGSRSGSPGGEDGEVREWMRPRNLQLPLSRRSSSTGIRRPGSAQLRGPGPQQAAAGGPGIGGGTGSFGTLGGRPLSMAWNDRQSMTIGPEALFGRQ